MEVSKLIKSKEPDARTTCTLTKEGGDSLACLTSEFGLTQKRIFSSIFEQPSLLDAVLDFAKTIGDTPEQRQTRKSVVIGKKDLKSLNEISKSNGLSRDLLIESTIRFLALLLIKDKDGRIAKHKEALGRLNDLWATMGTLEKELFELLADGDPILERYSKVVVVLINLVNEIEAEIATGANIDPEGI
ncbi:hypothetical protein [Geomonas propionica]|uniref:Uncharacterized protein n=1 Tax=Geomonas propionica TaxID=2798582 RepID=A0ABS0YP09_9BACT|nr:hypothetical protein [Geomonas propionica]MBJ6799713.1 hypothetical protein [Geomonas propionica]